MKYILHITLSQYLASTGEIIASVGFHVPWTTEAFFVGRGLNF